MKFEFLEHLGRDMRDSILRLLRDYSESLLLALILALILRQFVFASYRISNVMMEPSLRLGDFILGYKLPFGVNLPFGGRHLGQSVPRRGEVVIFKCPMNIETSCVKRVVALAGDRIEIRGQRLTVNGVQAKYNRSSSIAPEPLAAQVDLVVLKERIGSKDREILISSAKHNSDFGPYIVPPDSFFALGDNRDFSEDSRHWGAVPNRYIEARALGVWLSIDWRVDNSGEYHSQIRKNRVLTPIH